MFLVGFRSLYFGNTEKVSYFYLKKTNVLALPGVETIGTRWLQAGWKDLITDGDDPVWS